MRGGGPLALASYCKCEEKLGEHREASWLAARQQAACRNRGGSVGDLVGVHCGLDTCLPFSFSPCPAWATVALPSPRFPYSATPCDTRPAGYQAGSRPVGTGGELSQSDLLPCYPARSSSQAVNRDFCWRRANAKPLVLKPVHLAATCFSCGLAGVFRFCGLALAVP